MQPLLQTEYDKVIKFSKKLVILTKDKKPALTLKTRKDIDAIVEIIPDDKLVAIFGIGQGECCLAVDYSREEFAELYERSTKK